MGGELIELGERDQNHPGAEKGSGSRPSDPLLHKEAENRIITQAETLGLPRLKIETRDKAPPPATLTRRLLLGKGKNVGKKGEVVIHNTGSPAWCSVMT